MYNKIKNQILNQLQEIEDAGIYDKIDLTKITALQREYTLYLLDKGLNTVPINKLFIQRGEEFIPLVLFSHQEMIEFPEDIHNLLTQVTKAIDIPETRNTPVIKKSPEQSKINITVPEQPKPQEQSKINITVPEIKEPEKQPIPAIITNYTTIKFLTSDLYQILDITENDITTYLSDAISNLQFRINNPVKWWKTKIYIDYNNTKLLMNTNKDLEIGYNLIQTIPNVNESHLAAHLELDILEQNYPSYKINNVIAEVIGGIDKVIDTTELHSFKNQFSKYFQLDISLKDSK